MIKYMSLIAFMICGHIALGQTSNRFDATGNAGIGTTTPAQRLEILTNGASNLQLTNNWDVLGAVGALKFNMAGTEVGAIEAERTVAAGRLSALKFFVRSGSGVTGEAMRITQDANVGIGTTTPGAYKLAVEGTIGARKVKVTQSAWADFVFAPDYKLPQLYDVEKFIVSHGHLKDVPSAQDVKENGLDLGEMNKQLLQKIEELTLYIIQLRKDSDAQQQMIQQLQATIKK